MKPYIPKPLDTSKVMLPASVLELLEKLSENAHEVWAATRMAQGWTYGPTRDDARKQHPCLIPYDQLTESEKELDRAAVREALKSIVQLGYVIQPA